MDNILNIPAHFCEIELKNIKTYNITMLLWSKWETFSH